MCYSHSGQPFRTLDNETTLANLSESLLATESYEHYRVFVLTSVAGIFALFPLLIEPAGMKASGETYQGLTVSLRNACQVHIRQSVVRSRLPNAFQVHLQVSALLADPA